MSRRASSRKKDRVPTAPARDARSSLRRRHGWIALGAAVITFLAFAPSLQNPFVDWDDPENFVSNPFYRGLGVAQLEWMWTTTLLGHWVPLSWMTLGLDYLVWGMNPAGYHLTNALLHSASTAICYLVALRLFAAAAPAHTGAHPLAWRLSAAFATLVFALHPLRVESVAWITERRDVLSGLFYLLAIWAYLRDADVAGNASLRRRAWYWGSLGCFGLALLSKAIVVTLPIVLIVLDVYPLRRLGAAAGGWWSPEARRRWAEKVPFVVASAVVTPVALIAARSGANLLSIANFGLVDRLTVSLYGSVFYLWKTVVPLDLSPFYALRTPIQPLSTPYLVGAAVVAVVTALAILGRRRWPSVGAAWLVYVVTLVPVAGAFQNGPQIAADRYSYLPSLAVAMLAGGGVLAGWSALRGRGGRATAVSVTSACALVLTVLALLTWRQVGLWRDPERLWSHALAIAPSSMVHSHLGDVRRQQARWAEANEHYRQAVSLRPGAAHIWVNWGIALTQQGRLGDAIERYREAARLAPGSADAHHHWGNALFAAGAVAEAIDRYREAIRIDPGSAETYNNWGTALAQQGHWEEAIAKYREALRLRPNYPMASANLDRVLARSRQER